MPSQRTSSRVVRVALADPCTETILLVQSIRHQGLCWELPGGKVEENETIQQAARRELHEETGIWLPTLALRRYVWRAIPHDKMIGNEHYIYAGVYAGQTIAIDSTEISSYCWVTPAKAMEMPLDWWSKYHIAKIT